MTTIDPRDLRDLIAAQIASGLVANQIGWGYTFQGNARQIALYAYEVADEMIKVRNETLAGDHGTNRV